MKTRRIEKIIQSICPHNFIQGKRENNTFAHIFLGLGQTPTGIPGAVEILNSIERSLENECRNEGCELR